MGSEAIEAYVQDPSVRFILTERDPDSWVTSINRTLGEIINMGRQPHIRLLKYFDDDLFYFVLANKLTYMRIERHVNNAHCQPHLPGHGR